LKSLIGCESHPQILVRRPTLQPSQCLCGEMPLLEFLAKSFSNEMKVRRFPEPFRNIAFVPLE
ncbi:MAG: hypothetical protein WD066_20440, partial [Planctomycetaceae bacterium]